MKKSFIGVGSLAVKSVNGNNVWGENPNKFIRICNYRIMIKRIINKGM